MKTPTKKQLARIGHSLASYAESHNLETGAQTRGPVWRGPLPHRASRAVSYTPANAEANRKIDERNLGFGVAPGSGLASALATLRRSDRRALLAIVQRKAGTRRAREERALMRRLASRGITLGG